MSVFNSLPGNLGARANALVEAREADGRNVHFVNERGEYDRFSFESVERAQRFAANLRANGRTVFSSYRERLAHEYVALIGYDPFEDDPSATDASVADTLREYREEAGL